MSEASALGLGQGVTYAATSDGKVFASQGGSPDWTETALAVPEGSFVPRIEVNPADARQVVVAVEGPKGEGRVLATTDGGQTWQDLTGDLPGGLAAYTVAVDWTGPETWVGTDRGVYRSVGLAPRWTPAASGLPNTLVSDLRLAQGVLTAATYGIYGRGAFQMQVGS